MAYQVKCYVIACEKYRVHLWSEWCQDMLLDVANEKHKMFEVKRDIVCAREFIGTGLVERVT